MLSSDSVLVACHTVYIRARYICKDCYHEGQWNTYDTICRVAHSHISVQSTVDHELTASLTTAQRESLAGKKVGRIYSFRAFGEKVWRINRSAKRLLVVSTNLDGFSLANHGRFVKFATLSRYTVLIISLCTNSAWFPPISFTKHPVHCLYSNNSIISCPIKSIFTRTRP